MWMKTIKLPAGCIVPLSDNLLNYCLNVQPIANIPEQSEEDKSELKLNLFLRKAVIGEGKHGQAA